MKSEPPTPTRAPQDNRSRTTQDELNDIRNASLLHFWGWGWGVPTYETIISDSTPRLYYTSMYIYIYIHTYTYIHRWKPCWSGRPPRPPRRSPPTWFRASDVFIIDAACYSLASHIWINWLNCCAYGVHVWSVYCI